MNTSYQEYDHEYTFKFILVGNSNSGKTSLLQYFIKQHANTKIQQTVGVEFSSKSIDYKDKKIKLQIWDTAGQERFRSIARAYFKNTIGAIVVYDVTCQDSFHSLGDWIKDSRENGKSDLDIIVVANKIDLKDQRIVDKDYAQSQLLNKDVLYIETSAKTGENVDLCFQTLIDQIFTKIDKGQIQKDEFYPQSKNLLTKNLTIKINNPETQNQKCNC
ncbi:unnamed protein product [Paramecium sonneborni]|uniref:Uncharacterized protein n=1 Tax=Paramecium sonneborni TaxID=65129 RepID=A0A8S1KLT4_9CILI|nr:unnamed protein product [Paramecium sonneborni]